jgi:hypothetical protein
MHQNLRPELQQRTSNHALREEATLLTDWMNDTRPTDGPKADPVAQRLKYQVEKHLEVRYGKNADKVLAALEKSKPREENRLEKARVKYDEDGQPIDDGVDDGYGETGSPNTRMRYFGGGPKGTDLFIHPEDDPGKNGFPGAAMQRLAKIKAMYPDSTPRFITASEMGPDHPWIGGRYDKLVKIGNKAGVDGDRYAMKQLDRYGVIATERATHGTDLSFDELDAMKFDRHNYSAKDSSAAVHTGHFIERKNKDGAVTRIETVLDAVKVVKSMMARFEYEHVSDDLGEQARTARVGRMFIEGIAAVQAHLGKTFDIPGDTFLGKWDGRNVTWDDIKKLDRRTQADRENDDTTNYLVGLRQAIMATEDKALRKALIREGTEADAQRQLAKNRDLTREDSRKVDDKPGMGYTADEGIPMERRTHSRKTEDSLQTGKINKGIPGDTGLTPVSARTRRMNEIAGKLTELADRMAEGEWVNPDRISALRNELAELGKVRDVESTGRREVDPFGPTHDALRGEGATRVMKGAKGLNTRTYETGRSPEGINTNGGEARTPFLPQRENRPGTALPPGHPGALRSRAAELPPKEIGTDREYGDKSWPALRKAAAEAAKKFKDPEYDSDLSLIHI